MAHAKGKKEKKNARSAEEKRGNRSVSEGFAESGAPEPYYPSEFPGEPAQPEPDSPAGDDLPPEIDPQVRQILETGSVTMARGRHPIHCLTVIGQIEGHFILPPNNKTTKYEHVIPQIIAVDEDPEIEGLLIILNTVGGDVEAGLAIAELLATMKKPTVSLVLGGGHSIGVPLAVSCRRSFIAPTATMTIHPVRMNGLIVGVPQTLGYFYKMQDRIIKFVSDNSHITAKRFRELMMNNGELVLDVGTVLDGKAAVKEGLIDRLGGLSDAVECLYRLIEEQGAAKAARAGRPAQRKEVPETQAGGGRAASGGAEQVHAKSLRAAQARGVEDGQRAVGDGQRAVGDGKKAAGETAPRKTRGRPHAGTGAVAPHRS